MALTAPDPGVTTGVAAPQVSLDGPVLIGFADALAAPETAWSLVDAGLSVVAFARRGSHASLCRAKGIDVVEITAPSEDAGQAVADLRNHLAAERYAAVMPLDDSAVWVCNAATGGGTEVPVAGPIAEMAEFALNKKLQLEAAARAGFLVPPTRELLTIDDARAISDLPLMLKPIHACADRAGRLIRGRGYYCGTRAELERSVRRWNAVEPLLAQPLIAGVGEGLFGLAGADGVTALSAHRRVRMVNPHGSGSSACVSTAVDPDLALAAERMLTTIGWRGLFMLEFLRDADGNPWFMELNGRPWGSMALARDAGLEYPAWAVMRLADEAFQPAVPPVAEGQLCRHLGRELVHLINVLRGPKSVALNDWPSRWGTIRSVLRVSRHDRWYNWRRDDPWLFVADVWDTLVAEIIKH